MEECLLPAYAEWLSDGVAVLTDTGAIIDANRALARMLGFESKGRMCAALGAAPVFTMAADRDALARAVRAGETVERRLCAIANGGGEATSLLVTLMKRADGRLDAVFTRADDETAEAEIARLRMLLRHTQTHLAQTQRTKSVGSLSGFLAHELNNVFGSVIGRAQLLQMRTSDERVLRECAYIVQAAEQGVAEVKRLLHFIHKSRQQLFGPMAVQEVFEEACALLEPQFEDFRAAGIPLSIDKNFELHPKIFGYVPELREVIVQVMRNALEAMPEGGRITVSCLYGATDLSLTIADTGAGIDSEGQSKMFDPMYSTKSDQHAGMGLTVVKELLRKMKGSITYRTEPGGGSTFSITIPKNDVTPAGATLHKPLRQSELDQHFVSKILIVDDDEGVLISLDKLLSSKGFVTKALLDSREAVRTAKTFQPDVVITDLAMPDINGWELAKEMRAICPASKIIMTTAFTEMLSDVEMKQTSVDAVMQKPVNIQELMDRIMSV